MNWQVIIITFYLGGVFAEIVTSLDSLARHGTQFPLLEGALVNLGIAILWPLRIISAVMLASTGKGIW